MMMTNSVTELPIQKLKRAVNLRERIEALKLELDELLGAGPFRPAGRNRLTQGLEHTSPNGHGLSQNGRARIAAAQRLRWSKYKATHPDREKPASDKPRLSPAGRAKVAAAVRARWDRYRAAKSRLLRSK